MDNYVERYNTLIPMDHSKKKTDSDLQVLYPYPMDKITKIDYVPITLVVN